jgi:hypothetical protein
VTRGQETLLGGCVGHACEAAGLTAREDGGNRRVRFIFPAPEVALVQINLQMQLVATLG